MTNLGDLLRDVPPQQLDQPCSDEHLRDIALSITEWQTIAPFLELSEVDEEEIKCKYPHLLIRQNLGMLRRWRESFGSRATYRKLAEVFWRVGKVARVEQISTLLEAKDTVPEESLLSPMAQRSSRQLSIVRHSSTPPPSKRIRIDSSEAKPMPGRIETLGELLQNVAEDVETDCVRHTTSSQLCMVKDPILIRFSGPLATRQFQKIERAFYGAIHASKADDVEWATEKMLSLNVSTDYKAMSLLYRASCKAMVGGHLLEALVDCDEAIEMARLLECQNGPLITGRALRHKTGLLRAKGRTDEASKCVKEAKENFFLAAPSFDTAALLYEDVRLRIRIAVSKGEIVNFSEVEDYYNRILKHSHLLDDHHRPQMCVFLNAQAEVFLRTDYIKKDHLPPAAIAPTEEDLCRAEHLLNNVPLQELPDEAYTYTGRYYLARSDLCLWRKQYPEAIEWAERSQDQFTRGKATHLTNPWERLKLLKKLQEQAVQESKQVDEIVDNLSA